MLPEDEKKQKDIREISPRISAEEEAAAQARIMGLLHAIRTEQEKSRLYFTLIPLAFTVGLLLGYYISFINL